MPPKWENRSPRELRAVFGANLKELSKDYASISELARQLGINRTQFNRYLSGESFPRPDILARICAFFEMDARILLEPVGNLAAREDPLTGPVLTEYLGRGAVDVPESVFPSGFYRFSRRSFMDQSQFVVGIVWVFRDGRSIYIKGFEARHALEAQGLPPTARNRAFLGLVMQQDEGIAALISRRATMTFSFNYLHPASSFENNYWAGYVARTMRETPATQRVTRMVYEYLGTRVHDALAPARGAGYMDADDLLPLHRQYLQPNTAFT